MSNNNKPNQQPTKISMPTEVKPTTEEKKTSELPIPEVSPTPKEEPARIVGIDTAQPTPVKLKDSGVSGLMSNEKTRIENSLYTYKDKFEDAETAVDKAKAHAYLLELILSIMSNEDTAQFRLNWSTLLNHCQARKEFYTELTLLSHMHGWLGNRTMFDRYRFVVILLVASMNPSERQHALSKYDSGEMIRMISNGNADIRRNLSAFYI